MLLPKIFPVTCHTDHVGPGSTFVAIKGFADDGTQYISVALEKGATTIVLEHPSRHSAKSLIPQDERAPSSARGEELQSSVSNHSSVQELCKKYNATLIEVTDARVALADLSAQALNHPAHKLKIIGITGTKGKTTTSYIVEHILRSAGHKTAILGSIVHKILDTSQTSYGATPASDYLQIFFAQCVKAGVEYVIMEVSSHALALHRVHGVQFDAVGFTNLGLDHMDFHSDMDDYFATKIKIFSMLKPGGSIVINRDNPWGQKAFEFAQNMVSDQQANAVGFSNPTEFTSPALFGSFNLYNIHMAAMLCASQNIAHQTIKNALATFPGVPGRLQRHILQNGAQAFVDYAHNAMSVGQVLETLRPHTNHLIVVFGCGGDRDPNRRPGMGKIASELGDLVIITSDNPRTEDPDEIIKDILVGITPENMPKVICQPDRRKAIAMAAACATKDSIIALLGKGHEDYYLVQGQKLHFDDFEEISIF